MNGIEEWTEEEKALPKIASRQTDPMNNLRMSNHNNGSIISQLSQFSQISDSNASLNTNNTPIPNNNNNNNNIINYMPSWNR